MPDQGTPNRNRHEQVLICLMGVGLLAFIAFHVSPLWGWSHLLWFGGLMGLLAFLAFLNGALVSGYRNTLVFLCLGAGIGFAMEKVGIETGWVFGPYVYSEKLGPKFFEVPFVIPLCWFAVVYFAHVLANLIIHAHPKTRPSTPLQLVTLSLTTALIATGFDVAVDPVLSLPAVDMWSWTNGGEFFGVPFRNFQGWLVTSFLIDLCYRAFAERAGTRPISSTPTYATLCAVGAWVGLAVGFMLIGDPIEAQMIAVFTILAPAILASVAFYHQDDEKT